MRKTSALVVHGFAVTSSVFRPLLSRLRDRSLVSDLFRYPSVGLPLEEIVDRLVVRLQQAAPDALVAHSLGCFVTALAVERCGWQGRIVFMAAPLRTLPLTRLIPSGMRWPFAPLLDHRKLTSAADYRPPLLDGCRVKSIVGRCDLAVPLACSQACCIGTTQISWHSHNSMLFSRRVAGWCADWGLAG